MRACHKVGLTPTVYLCLLRGGTLKPAAFLPLLPRQCTALHPLSAFDGERRCVWVSVSAGILLFCFHDRVTGSPEGQKRACAKACAKACANATWSWHSPILRVAPVSWRKQLDCKAMAR